MFWITHLDGFYEEPFSIDSWFVNSVTSPYAGIYQLRKMELCKFRS